MPAIDHVLVIGAGVAGPATAILLAERGVSVDLVDVRPDVAVTGSGITLQGNALRVLQQLGVWDRVLAEGYPFDTTGLRAPDPAGSLIVAMDDMKTGGPDLPATLGMPRPVLAQILVDRATEVGAKLRLGTSCTALTQDDDGVDVTFNDGTDGRYDLVVGADGVRSWTRRELGIELETVPLGMGIWRVFTTRPASVTRTDLYYGGPSYIAGYCPTGENSLYAYIVEPLQDRSGLSQAESLAVIRELASAYHGPWDDIRATLDDATAINYAQFESHVLRGPWHRGRVALLGDAAHACPPTLAQGAAQALEDAAVLGDLLVTHDALTDELWTTFADRRQARATEVVEASVQLAQWLLDHERGDVPALMGRISHLLMTPA